MQKSNEDLIKNLEKIDWAPIKMKIGYHGEHLNIYWYESISSNFKNKCKSQLENEEFLRLCILMIGAVEAKKQ